MKRLARLALIPLVLLLLLAAICLAVPAINDRTAAELEHTLLDAPRPADAVLIDHACAAGKLTGNGNGMQYFAVIVIRTALSADVLDAHYAPLRRSSFDFLLCPAADADRLPLTHLDLLPDYPDDAWFVFSWGDSSFPLCDLDLRAH